MSRPAKFVMAICLCFAVIAVGFVLSPYSFAGSANLSRVKAKNTLALKQQLQEHGLTFGSPIFIRIFKEPNELELWVKQGDQFARFKNYPICKYSGDLGPKLKEGDGQSPEGFYQVSVEQMNPNSSYHLSFNLGFPNVYDKSHGRTGSYLMVHGNCVSVGCYAMTNEGVEEIYLLAEAAHAGGQKMFSVHSYPFRMTEKNMQARPAGQWSDFWRNLQEGYDYFEKQKNPAVISVQNKRYKVN
jgi:murein L,D-transpeptidase YafK